MIARPRRPDSYRAVPTLTFEGEPDGGVPRTTEKSPDDNPVCLDAVQKPVVVDEYLPEHRITNFRDDTSAISECREAVGRIQCASQDPNRSARRAP